MKESRFSREIRAEARLETRRADVLDILEERFGAGLREEIEPALNGITDFDDLGQLLLLATDCACLNEFRAALPKQRAGR